MAAISKTRVANATLTGSTVDTVTLAGPYPVVEVVNRSGANFIWVRASGNGTPPSDPTVAGDECEPVAPGERRVVLVGAKSPIVKIIGNGDAYSVVGGLRQRT